MVLPLAGPGLEAPAELALPKVMVLHGAVAVYVDVNVAVKVGAAAADGDVAPATVVVALS